MIWCSLPKSVTENIIETQTDMLVHLICCNLFMFGLPKGYSASMCVCARIEFLF